MKSHWIRVALVVAAAFAALVLAAPGGSDTGSETVKPSRKGEVIALKAVTAKSGYAVRHARCAERLSDL